MKRVIASAGLLALGAAGVQTAHAQLTAGSEKPWSVSATLRGFYDDNYNTQPDGVGRVSSFGFEVKPKLSYNLSTDQTTLDVSYAYTLLYYDARANNKEDQDHDFELALKHEFSPRYSVSFVDSFVIAQEPEVIDPGLSSPLRSNGDNLRNRAGIMFNAEMTPLLGFELGYANTIYDYKENAGNTTTPAFPSRSALLDRVEHLANIDSRWHLWEQTTAIFGYQFGAVQYTSGENIDSPLPSPFIASSTRNNYSHYVYVGLEHQFSQSLSASGRVGIQYLDYYNSPTGNKGNSLSPYVDLSLSYAYMDGGSLSLGFHHAHNQTDEAASVLNPGSITLDQESSTVFGSLSQKLTPLSPKLTGSLTAQYQNSSFNGGPFDSETDNIYLVGLNFSYQFNHYISAETGYNYDLLKSDLPSRGYDRNRVYIGVTASY
jgi:hypothetical protein